MAINLRSYYYEYDSVSDEYTFVCQIKLFMNQFGLTDVLDIKNDFWIEDQIAYTHIVGRGFSEDPYYEGFIGDIIYGNYSYDTQVNYVTSVHPTSPAACPSALEAPESKEYIQCVDECNSLFQNSSQIDLDSCIDDCVHDPFCPDICVQDDFMDEENNFACTDCALECESCRNPVTCDVCDDILCAGCSSYYSICDGGCKPNA